MRAGSLMKVIKGRRASCARSEGGGEGALRAGSARGAGEPRATAGGGRSGEQWSR